MIGNLTLLEIKPLKGPDRLLRIKVLVNNTFDIQSSIEMLEEVVKSLIYKYHKIYLEFPVSSLIDKLPNNNNFFSKYYGEILNGMLGLEILFNYRTESNFKIRYYSEDLEFQRKLMSLDSYVSINKVNMDEYVHPFTIDQIRNGIHVEPFLTKITYTKSL